MTTTKNLEINAALQIRKPVHVVFEAIVDPDINLRKGGFDFLRKKE